MKIWGVLIICMFMQSCTESQERVHEVFNQDWKFNKGEAGEEHSVSFNDGDWRNLNLPHDWAIEGPFDKANDTRTGGSVISAVEDWIHPFASSIVTV